jgi:hypothetical protein
MLHRSFTTRMVAVAAIVLLVAVTVFAVVQNS